MDFKKVFATNAEKEKEGVWVDMGSGARVKIARAGNPDYVVAVRELLRPHQAAIRAKRELPPDVLEDITVKVAARSLLRDWENMTEAGETVPYSAGNAERCLRQYPDFAAFVAACAADMKLFQDEEEALAKN